MRRTIVAAVAAVLVATGGALAAPAAAPLDLARRAAEPVQYYPAPYGYRGDFDEQRHYRRQLRRAHEEERIAEAARREAWRIERERAERRAFRHAQRERYGYYHRGF